MATFQLSPAIPERKDINVAAQEDNALRMWAFSPWRTSWQLACAFLNTGYGRCKFVNVRDTRLLYRQVSIALRMYGLHSTPDGRTLMVKFVNFRDARLIYGQAFHCGCEMVVFTCANIFTKYWDQFPNNGNFIHRVVPELPMAQEVPPAYPKVPSCQETSVALKLSFLSVSKELLLAAQD